MTFAHISCLGAWRLGCQGNARKSFWAQFENLFTIFKIICVNLHCLSSLYYVPGLSILNNTNKLQLNPDAIVGETDCILKTAVRMEQWLFLLVLNRNEKKFL
jgi:hypothetical protein